MKYRAGISVTLSDGSHYYLVPMNRWTSFWFGFWRGLSQPWTVVTDRDWYRRRLERQRSVESK